MPISLKIFRFHSLALTLSLLSAYLAAANLNGVFDSGLTTAYQSADSLTHVH